MPVGLDRNKQVQRIVLRIDEVDIPSRAVHGYDKSNVLVVATFRETPNGILAVPAQNERWIAQREGMGQWRLIGRLDSADQQTWAETNLGPGDMRIEADNIWFTGTVHGITGGGAVDSVFGRTGVVVAQTGDYSVAQVTGAAPLASPAFTGVPTAPTPLPSDDSTTLATTAYVQSQGYLTSAVTSFNTRTGAVTLLLSDVTGTGLSFSDVGALGATAAAGGDLTGNYPNPTIKTSVALSGNPTATTQLATDNSTRIATTAYVQSQGYLTSSTGVTSFNTRTGAVTLSKVDVTGTGLSFSDVGALGATAAAGGDLTGNYPNPTIKSSVGLGGNPTTTTQTATDSSTKIATTAFVHAAIAADSVVRIQVTQTSHGFSVGNVLYYTGSAYALAKADNADDAEVVGIVATVVDANNFILQAAGEVTGLSGLTAGTTYFLSDSTAGLLTATAPTTNGSISKPLGIAVSTTALYFYNMRGEVIQASASFPTVITSSWSAGPPGSPSDGDIWIASGVDSNGVRWQFQYNAGSASAYKWEFIGGAPMYAATEADEATTSTTYTTLTTAGPSLSLVRAGDWDVMISCETRNSGANDGGVMSYDIGGTAADDGWGLYQVGSSNSTGTSAMNINGLMRLKRHTSLAASITLTAKYRAATAGTANFNYRRMSAVPVRIS